MKRLAVFLDRDGTLIEDRGHLIDPAQVAFFPETAPALRRLGGQFRLFIVTNQSGVAKGVTRPEEVRRVNDYVVAHLREEGSRSARSTPAPTSGQTAARVSSPTRSSSGRRTVA